MYVCMYVAKHDRFSEADNVQKMEQMSRDQCYKRKTKILQSLLDTITS